MRIFDTTPFRNQLHRLDAHILQRAQRIDQRPIADGKCSLGPVHTRRRIGQLQPLADFLEVHCQLVGQVQITVHHTSHKLDRMIGLQPRGLIADDRISSGVGFVKAVVGKLLQKVKNLGRFLLVDPVFLGTFLEFGALLGHFLGNLFTHRTAQQISATKRITRHDLRNLHHLFLIHDNALGFFKNMVDQRMNRFKVFQPVLHLTIGRNVLHRTRAVKRHKGHDILDTGRLHLLQGIHHARAFNLKHSHRFGGSIKLVRRLIIERNDPDIINRSGRRIKQLGAVGGDMQMAAVGLDQIYRVLDHSQGFQTQKVELDQTSLLNPFHIELGGGHVRSRVLIQRHKRVQRPVANHNTRRMGRGIAQQSFNLLTVIEQAFDDLLIAGLFAQTRLVFQGFFNADRFDALNRDHLGQTVHLPIGHLQHATNIADSGLGQKRTKGDDLSHFVAAIFILNISDHIFTAVHAKIDIEVGHGHTFRVQKPLEQQVITQRIQIGDGQGISDKRPRAGTTTGPHRNTLILGPLDKIGNDQKVAGKAHALDHIKLKL